jgi:hypothetical protein
VTTPTPHGYPDFGRYTALADVIHNNESATVISVNATRGPFFVGSTDCLGVRVVAAVNNLQLVFEYYADQAITQLLTDIIVHVNQGQTFDQTIPVEGPWCRIRIEPNAFNATFTLVVWQAPRSGAALSTTSADNLLISQTAVAIAGATTTTFTATRVAAREAYIFMHIDGTGAWECTLRSRDRAGTLTGLFYASSGTKVQSGVIFLPAQPCEIVAHNIQASAQSLWLFLGASPLRGE